MSSAYTKAYTNWYTSPPPLQLVTIIHCLGGPSDERLSYRKMPFKKETSFEDHLSAPQKWQLFILTCHIHVVYTHILIDGTCIDPQGVFTNDENIKSSSLSCTIINAIRNYQHYHVSQYYIYTPSHVTCWKSHNIAH